MHSSTSDNSKSLTDFVYMLHFNNITRIRVLNVISVISMLHSISILYEQFLQVNSFRHSFCVLLCIYFQP